MEKLEKIIKFYSSFNELIFGEDNNLIDKNGTRIEATPLGMPIFLSKSIAGEVVHRISCDLNCDPELKKQLIDKYRFKELCELSSEVEFLEKISSKSPPGANAYLVGEGNKFEQFNNYYQILHPVQYLKINEK